MAIPDAWTDLNHNGQYDAGEPYDPLVTGYGPGTLLSLRQADAVTPTIPGTYFPVDFPALNRGTPLSGHAWYGKWLVECSPFELLFEDTLLVEPGGVQDTTFMAFLGLINQDPSAHWDESTQSVMGSRFDTSPRLVTVLGYNPIYPPEAGRPALILTKFLWMFVESVGPSTTIHGRIMDATTDVPVAAIPTTWGTLKSKY